jgi:hypothetical protein
MQGPSSGVSPVRPRASWLLAQHQGDCELLPGCGIPGHLVLLLVSLQSRNPGYFQVALSHVMTGVSFVASRSSVISRLRNRKSRCPRSSVLSIQVCAVWRFRNRVTSRLRNPRSFVLSRWLCVRHWSRKSGYFQVAESQVIAVLQSSRSSVIVSERRVTSRWRNPRSSVLSPFIGSLLPGCGLERDSVPGHGRDSSLEARERRASRFRGCPRSCQSSRRTVAAAGCSRDLAKDFACVPRHI